MSRTQSRTQWQRLAGIGNQVNRNKRIESVMNSSSCQTSTREEWGFGSCDARIFSKIFADFFTGEMSAVFAGDTPAATDSMMNDS
jgi:hypothetical protein